MQRIIQKKSYTIVFAISSIFKLIFINIENFQNQLLGMLKILETLVFKC
jgi:hypothetical protein